MIATRPPYRPAFFRPAAVSIGAEATTTAPPEKSASTLQTVGGVALVGGIIGGVAYAGSQLLPNHQLLGSLAGGAAATAGLLFLGKP